MSEYFYLDRQNQRQGPVSTDNLKANGVNATTLVWTQGMTDWMPAGQVAELAPLFIPSAENSAQSAAQQPYQQPQQPQQSQAFIAKPDNYLIWAIIATFCCCNILGVVACIKAAKVDAYFESGNHVMANQQSKEARKWVFIAFGCGLLVWLIYIAFYAFIGISLFNGIGSNW